MKKIKEFINIFLNKKFAWKVVSYWLLIIIFYIFSDFLGLFLLTFIFAYLFLTTSEFLKIKFDNLLLLHCKNQKKVKVLKKIVWLNFIIISLYLIFILIVIFIISDIIPKLTWELQSVEKVIWWANNIKDQLYSITNSFDLQYNINLTEHLKNIFTNLDLSVIVKDTTGYLSKAGKWFIYIIFSLVMSFVFIMDRKRLQKYFLWIKKSTYGFLYKEYKIIFDKVLKSFGLIIKAQSLIAFANASLTVLWLLIIWFFYHNSIGWYIFPYILTLWLIVFLVGFIPILWVFISSIPILLIAYLTIWWWPILITIILLIFIIHFIEAYYLNPKIVSSFLEIPVSLTFLILLISEHIFWVAGLIIWVSLFYFVVWLFRDIDKAFLKKRKKLNK